MVLALDVNKYGFKLVTGGEYESVVQVEGKAEWSIRIKYDTVSTRKTWIKIKRREVLNPNKQCFDRVKFDGFVSTKEELEWVLVAVGVINI